MSGTVEITRYPNRRLYDRSQKKYVTVSDIERIVMQGQDVRIVDNKTGEDLTRMVLIQLILERHPERIKMFPVAFLHEMLRADQFALDWFTVYFGQAKKLLEGLNQSANPVIANPIVPGLDFWKAFMPGSTAPKKQPTANSESENQAELAAKLRELEQRLAQMEHDGSKGTAPKSKDSDEEGGHA